MARAPQAARRRSAPVKAVPTGLWAMVGVVIVLFVGILFWLGSRPEQPVGDARSLPLQTQSNGVEPKAVQKDVREVRAETPAQAAKPPVPPPPRYDFYQMLPEQRVGTNVEPPPQEEGKPAQSAARPPVPTDIPPSKMDAATEKAKEVASLPPATEKPKVSPAAAPQVMLQVGSFRRFEEADRRKAELALLGFSASVQTANVNGETWHRVKIGPLSDAEARKARDRLKAVGMNPMLVKGG
ncbi:MAG: SPOR domain-containing protein [Pseudomonadota bacterium]